MKEVSEEIQAVRDVSQSSAVNSNLESITSVDSDEKEVAMVSSNK